MRPTSNKKKKKRPARQQGVSSIKHYYKIQNLEGILVTFSSYYQPFQTNSVLKRRCKDTHIF